MNTEIEVETLRVQNQSFKENLPRFQKMANLLNNEVIQANNEAMKWKSMYLQAQNENRMLNLFNLAFIGMMLGTVGATIIFLSKHI